MAEQPTILLRTRSIKFTGANKSENNLRRRSLRRYGSIRFHRTNSEKKEETINLPPSSPLEIEKKLNEKGDLIFLSKETEDEKEKRLQKVESTIMELLDTERDYLNDLNVMIKKIMKPMSEKKDFLTGKPLISASDIQKIWSNILMLPRVNEVLLQEFEKVKNVNGEDRQMVIAEAFINTADYMKIYTEFCSNQPVSTATVQELMKNSQFEAFLAEKADVSVMEESRNLDLNSFLIKPVQRICKYPLFLRDLLKVTPFDHDCFLKLHDAAKKIDGVVLSINETKKKAENSLQLASIADKISNLPFPLLIPGRDIRFFSEFKKIMVSKNWVKGTVFLFNDIIVFTRVLNVRRKNKLKYLSHGVVRHINLTIVKERDAYILQSTGRVNFKLLFDSKDILDHWFTEVQKTVDQQKALLNKRHYTF